LPFAHLVAKLPQPGDIEVHAHYMVSEWEPSCLSLKDKGIPFSILPKDTKSEPITNSLFSTLSY